MSYWLESSSFSPFLSEPPSFCQEFTKGIGRKWFPCFVLICSENKSEQIERKEQTGANRGIPENKERKSEHIGRESEQIGTIGVTPFCRTQIGKPPLLGRGTTLRGTVYQRHRFWELLAFQTRAPRRGVSKIGKSPKVARRGCKRSFGPRSPKSLLHHVQPCSAPVQHQVAPVQRLLGSPGFKRTFCTLS